jgi:Mn-dependent DtxR family transcriptional regulator
MLKSLAGGGYLSHEAYRGIKLTERGERVARSVISRHETLVEFLTTIGVNEAIASGDAEEIEHHIHSETTHALKKLTTVLRKHPALLESLQGPVQSRVPLA